MFSSSAAAVLGWTLVALSAAVQVPDASPSLHARYGRVLSRRAAGGAGDGCRQCQPGSFALTPCFLGSATVCLQCPPGSFTAAVNLAPRCRDCSRCGAGTVQIRACSPTADAVCLPCSPQGCDVSRLRHHRKQGDDVTALRAPRSTDHTHGVAASENGVTGTRKDDTGNDVAGKDFAENVVTGDNDINDKDVTDIKNDVNGSDGDEDTLDPEAETEGSGEVPGEAAVTPGTHAASKAASQEAPPRSAEGQASSEKSAKETYKDSDDDINEPETRADGDPVATEGVDVSDTKEGASGGAQPSRSAIPGAVLQRLSPQSSASTHPPRATDPTSGGEAEAEAGAEGWATPGSVVVVTLSGDTGVGDGGSKEEAPHSAHHAPDTATATSPSQAAVVTPVQDVHTGQAKAEPTGDEDDDEVKDGEDADVGDVGEEVPPSPGPGVSATSQPSADVHLADDGATSTPPAVSPTVPEPSPKDDDDDDDDNKSQTPTALFSTDSKPSADDDDDGDESQTPPTTPPPDWEPSPEDTNDLTATDPELSPNDEDNKETPPSVSTTDSVTAPHHDDDHDAEESQTPTAVSSTDSKPSPHDDDDDDDNKTLTVVSPTDSKSSPIDDDDDDDDDESQTPPSVSPTDSQPTPDGDGDKDQTSSTVTPTDSKPLPDDDDKDDDKDVDDKVQTPVAVSPTDSEPSPVDDGDKDNERDVLDKSHSPPTASPTDSTPSPDDDNDDDKDDGKDVDDKVQTPVAVSPTDSKPSTDDVDNVGVVEVVEVVEVSSTPRPRTSSGRIPSLEEVELEAGLGEVGAGLGDGAGSGEEPGFNLTGDKAGGAGIVNVHLQPATNASDNTVGGRPDADNVSGREHEETLDGDLDSEGTLEIESARQGGDTEEDRRSKERTAIIVGVTIGGVAFFAIGFFLSRRCRKRGEFKVMKKVPTENGTSNGKTDSIEFRPLGGGTSIYEVDERPHPGSYRRVGEDAYTSLLPASTDHVTTFLPPDCTYAVVSKKAPHQSPDPHDQHVSSLGRIRYIDETTTDDEGGDPGPPPRLLPPPPARLPLPHVQEDEEGPRVPPPPPRKLSSSTGTDDDDDDSEPPLSAEDSPPNLPEAATTNGHASDPPSDDEEKSDEEYEEGEEEERGESAPLHPPVNSKGAPSEAVSAEGRQNGVAHS